MQRNARRLGFSLIELLIVIAIILVIAAIAIPNLSTQLQGAHEMAAIREVNTIQQAQTQYNSQFGRYATALNELGPPTSGAPGEAAADMIPKTLAEGKASGYSFTMRVTPAGYAVSAVPEGSSGRRTFYSDQTLVVRSHSGPDPADINSAPIK